MPHAQARSQACEAAGARYSISILRDELVVERVRRTPVLGVGGSSSGRTVDLGPGRLRYICNKRLRAMSCPTFGAGGHAPPRDHYQLSPWRAISTNRSTTSARMKTLHPTRIVSILPWRVQR